MALAASRLPGLSLRVTHRFHSRAATSAEAPKLVTFINQSSRKKKLQEEDARGRVARRKRARQVDRVARGSRSTIPCPDRNTCPSKKTVAC
jgi:hypothetical protein